MKIFLLIAASLLGLVLLYVLGVYLYNFIARLLVRNQPPLPPDAQRSSDYAAYKAKM